MAYMARTGSESSFYIASRGRDSVCSNAFSPLSHKFRSNDNYGAINVLLTAPTQKGFAKKQYPRRF
jgi:hypothetical protein